MKAIGFTLTGQDNDTYMFEDEGGLDLCPECGYWRNFIVWNPQYRMNNKQRCPDISITYDGQVIVSKKFRDTIESTSVDGVLFREFVHETNLFHFSVLNIISFDAECAKTRFIKLCPVCGNYESVVGIRPACFNVDRELPLGIYRSDLVFGSGNEKHPLLVVSFEIHDRLKAAGLKGLEFKKAYQDKKARSSAL